MPEALRSEPARAGFNMLELMIVLTILGIVLAAAVPSFTQKNSHYRAEAAARDLACQIQMARQRAVNDRVPFRLTLDPSAIDYYCERQTSDSTWVLDPDKTYHACGVAAMIPHLGQDGAGGNDLFFETGGTVRAEDVPAEIRFTSELGDTATVVLVRTGRVTVRVTPQGQ